MSSHRRGRKKEKKKVAYHLSFVITHPSRATDTHTHTQADRSAARCTDIGKACMYQHLHAHSLLFTTCANLRLLSPGPAFFFFSACSPKGSDLLSVSTRCDKYANVGMNDGAAGEQTVQKYKCCFPLPEPRRRVSSPARLSHTQEQVDMERKTECVGGRAH